MLMLLLLFLLLLVLLEHSCGSLLKLRLLQCGCSDYCIRRLLLTLAVGVCCSCRRGRSQLSMIGGHRTVVVPGLFSVVNKVASGPIRAEPYAVERTAEFGLVLWVTLEIAQFLHAVRELALVPVLTLTRFLEWSAQLGFISRGIDLLRQRFRLRTFQLSVASASATAARSTTSSRR